MSRHWQALMGHFIALCFLFFFWQQWFEIERSVLHQCARTILSISKNPRNEKGTFFSFFFSFFELALHSESLCWNTKFFISAPCDIREGNGASTHPGCTLKSPLHGSFGFWRIKKNCKTGGNLLDSEAPGQYREKTCHDCCSRALSWHFYAITACLKHPSINFLSPPPLASCSHSHQSAGLSPSCLPRVEAGLQPNSMQTTIHTNSNTLNVAGHSDLLVFEGTSGL